MDCEHMEFMVHADVNRLTDQDGSPRVKAFCMDLRVFCKECGLQFEFVGLPLGYSVYRPTVNIAGLEAHIPIIPPGKLPDPDMPGYSVKFTEPGQEPGLPQ